MNLEPLAENLEEQVKLHESLLDVLRKESELPASCKLEDLESLQAGKNQIVEELKKLEQSRKRVVQDYARENQLETDISLKEIIADELDDPFKDDLSSSRNNLLEVVDAVRKMGQETASTASARLLGIHEIQMASHRAYQRSPLYSQKGKVTEPKGAFLVQKKI